MCNKILKIEADVKILKNQAKSGNNDNRIVKILGGLSRAPIKNRTSL